jgi:hypothetical protein
VYSKIDPKTPIKKKKKLGKTSEEMEGFCSVISVTCLKRPHTDKDNDYLMGCFVPW